MKLVIPRYGIANFGLILPNICSGATKGQDLFVCLHIVVSSGIKNIPRDSDTFVQGIRRY